MRTEESVAHRTLTFIGSVGLSMSTADVVDKALAVGPGESDTIYFPTHITSSLVLALSSEAFRCDAIDLVVV